MGSFEPNEKLELSQAFKVAYRQVKQIAHRQKLRFYSLDTLNTTAIVHEAYMKLERNHSSLYEGETHFFRLAAKAIRQLLINYAEYKMAEKRGKGVKADDIAAFEGKISLSEESAESLLQLNEALRELEKLSPRQFQLVEARFFGGMTIEDAAESLGVSPATAKRDWTFAKTWLYSRINKA
ncbi:MAG: ECF-type sigma factor [Bacteroidia bacterium]|nr:ECF-type sigma factor [Bacteroidia bacterium]